MDRLSKEIQADLNAVQAGELDALTPDQIARLEEHLNADAAVAARLAGVTPPANVPGQGDVELPSAETWERVWERVDAATTSELPAKRTLFMLRGWRPVIAAAAVCVLAVGLWRSRPASPAADWPVEWAHEVEVSDIEVFGDGTPLVIAAGTGETIPVIWVLEGGT